MVIRRHKGRKSCADARLFNSHLDWATFEKLQECWWAGATIRVAARECGIAKETVHAMYKRLEEGESEILGDWEYDGGEGMPPTVLVDGKLRIACACGQWRGHRGWCSSRLAKSPDRQSLMARLHARQREGQLQRNPLKFKSGILESTR